MKRKEWAALLLVGAILSGLFTAGAAEAGSAGDPLIALNWLKTTFLPSASSELEQQVKDGLDKAGEQILADGSVGTEQRVKRSDVLWLESGATVTPLAGQLSILSFSQGAVVDVTTGEEMPSSGGTAVNQHRYLVAEDTRAAFSVDSDTAVVRLGGVYQLTPSAEPDYNAMADALKTAGLFQGSDVPYGSGYDLESAPTRIQGLVMFLRLLGEEQAALNYPGSGITFADVPDWAVPYVAYAYDKGYTKGQEIDNQWRVVFGSQAPLAARDYTTFLLRALGYADGTDFQWLSAVSDAQALGVLTQGEAKLLGEKDFLRAQVVYLSCTALSAPMAGGSETLLAGLTASGAVSGEGAAALSSLKTQRL